MVCPGGGVARDAIHRDRRLFVRFDRRDDTQAGFVGVDLALISWFLGSNYFSEVGYDRL